MFLQKPIETDRLLLRSTEHGDAEALFAIGSRKETAYWSGMEPLESVGEAVGIINFSMILDRHLELAIVEKESRRMVGVIDADLEKRERKTVGTLGYFLSPEVSRHGYMSEGVNAVCQYLFDSLGVDMVMCEIRKDNIPSRGVARKCGFVLNPNQKVWRLNYYGKPLDEFILYKTRKLAGT